MRAEAPDADYRLAGLLAAACALAACEARAPVTTLRLPRPSEAVLLVDREEVFPAALALIRSARREVLLGMYLLGGAPATATAPAGIGRQVVDALLERRAAGVSVRVINEELTPLPDRRLVPVPGDDWFHPVFSYAREHGLPILAPCTRHGAIDHTKYLLVDGEVALFGGMNLADAVATNHDVMLRVRGPFVGELRALFAQAWACALAAADDPGPARDLGPLPSAPEPPPPAGPDACATSLWATTPTERTIRPGLLQILGEAGAGDTVHVAMLLLNDRQLTEALLAARRRGAAVRVLLDANAGYYNVDCQVAFNAETAVRLADGGVEVRLFANSPGAELHMKAVAVRRASGEVLFGLGSANWTSNAMRRNWETYAVFRGCPAVAQRMWTLLVSDFATRGVTPTPTMQERWRRPKEREALVTECQRRLRDESFFSLAGQ